MTGPTSTYNQNDFGGQYNNTGPGTQQNIYNHHHPVQEHPEETRITKCLNDLQVEDPELDMERIEGLKDTLLKDCYNWILKDSSLRQWRDTDTCPLLWINGDPGKGKTMLMIALVRELSRNAPRKKTILSIIARARHLSKNLLGNSPVITFFFCQSGERRLNNAASILRGLIWKLAVNHAQLANIFCQEYESNKNMLAGPNAIFALFKVLRRMLDKHPRAFILIDALDECESGPERDKLLSLITKYAISSPKTKWLLSSRNYPEIKELLVLQSQILSLELNDKHISRAVDIFIQKKTCELAAKKGYNQKITNDIQNELIAKADATFLWVALACKSLQDSKATSQKAVSLLRELPPGLIPLYARMMEQIPQNTVAEDQELCFEILRSVCLAVRPLSLDELVKMMERPTKVISYESLRELVDRCGSFINIQQGIIYTIHQSAREYLVADRALFSAGLQKEHGLLVGRLLDAMSKTLRRDMLYLKHPGALAPNIVTNTSLTAISYACCFWVDHVTKYLDGNSIDSLPYKEYLLNRGIVHRFLLQHLLHWFETLSLLREYNAGILALQGLEKMIRPKITESQLETPPSLDSFVHDALRVFLQCRPAVEEAPLQVYNAGLLFAPLRSAVRNHFEEDIPNWVQVIPQIENDWTPCLQTLEGHSGWVWSVAFSADGRQLASASSDHTVRLWDATTGAALQTLAGHSDRVNSVAFSADGRQLASASSDHTVRLWDATTGAALQTLAGHSDWVRSVAFSADGRQLASASNDNTVRLWDATTGTALQTLVGHSDWVWSVAFSADGRQLASASNDNTVRLWDATTGTALQTLTGHSGPVISVAFSPDGQNLVTDREVIRLNQSPANPPGPDPTRSGYSIGSGGNGYGIGSGGKWITLDGDKVLWLPPEYRPSCSAVEKHRIAVGCPSGRLYFLNLHPSVSPLDTD